MKFLVPSFLLLCAGINVQAQNTNSEYHALNGNTWSVKGKVLPWMLLGSGINYSLGLEYDFKRVHAIGIDLVYNDYSSENDVYDSSKKDYVSGPREYTVVRGAFLTYRRYFNPESTWIQRPLHWLLKDKFLPYAGAFLRYGKTDLHDQKGYVTNMVSYDEWQYSGGLLIGLVCDNIDVNIGPFYKTKYITDVEMEYGDKVYHSYAQSNFGLRVGVDLFLTVKNRGNHLLHTLARQ